MSSDFEPLIRNLQKAGWGNFAPGEFFGLQFESIGKAKVAQNNWFVLLKPLPVLDAAALSTWSTNYQMLLKKTPAGFFNSGKYFILMLLAETMSPDAIAVVSQATQIDFLEMPKSILRGGGFTLLLLKDRQKIFMPKTVSLPPVMGAMEFLKQTHLAL